MMMEFHKTATTLPTSRPVLINHSFTCHIPPTDFQRTSRPTGARHQPPVTIASQSIYQQWNIKRLGTGGASGPKLRLSASKRDGYRRLRDLGVWLSVT